MSEETQLRRLLLRYGIAEESDCGRAFLTFLRLLEKWIGHVNLAGSRSWHTLGPLFEEGIWAAQFYPHGGTQHLDIGSGAGFPAIPLCLLNPDMQLCMVESRTKRVVFLETLCEALSLERARVFHGTLESMLRSTGDEQRWDCISWKAIRLKRKDFELLVQRAAAGAAFWVFQGADIPVEGGISQSPLLPESSRSVPGKPAWQLSIYHKTPIYDCFT